MRTFSGHLKDVKGYYAIVIYTNVNGVKKSPQWNTGLSVKGNKTHANKLLRVALLNFKNTNSEYEYNMLRKQVQKAIYDKIIATPSLQKKLSISFSKKLNQYKESLEEKENKNIKKTKPVEGPCVSIYRGPNTKDYIFSKDSLFYEYIEVWMRFVHSQNCNPSTWSKGYSILKNRDIPYFKQMNKTLKEIDDRLLSYYYQSMTKGYYIDKKYYKPIKPSTVYQHHWLLSAALNYAVQHKVLSFNPASGVRLPKQKVRVAKDVYTIEELQTMFQLIEGNPCEYPVLMAAFYGLRRSEILGLKWKDINFEKKYIQINRGVHYTEINGTHQLYISDSTKSLKSTRTLPLLKPIENMLLRIQNETKQNRMRYKDKYSLSYKDYVFVDRHGKLRNPQSVSKNFKNFLLKNNLHYISLHNLRHTIGTLLCQENVNLEKIRDWLGHSSIEITSKYYLHMSYQSKIDTAQVIEKLMPINHKTVSN